MLAWWECRLGLAGFQHAWDVGPLHAIQADTMVLVRAMMPVRGVVHVQTANRFGWRARNPSPTGPMRHRAGYERLTVTSGRLLTLT